MITTATISIQAVAYDTQSELIVRIYPNEQMEMQDQKKLFGTANEEGLDEEVDLIGGDYYDVCNYANAYSSFNLLKRTTSSPSLFIVLPFVFMLEVGLIIKLRLISSPLDIPPRIPPELFEE